MARPRPRACRCRCWAWSATISAPRAPRKARTSIGRVSHWRCEKPQDEAGLRKHAELRNYGDSAQNYHRLGDSASNAHAVASARRAVSHQPCWEGGGGGGGRGGGGGG